MSTGAVPVIFTGVVHEELGSCTPCCPSGPLRPTGTDTTDAVRRRHRLAEEAIMTHTPLMSTDTLPAPRTPAAARPPRDTLDGADARLMAGLASATSLAGAASATWTALRAF